MGKIIAFGNQKGGCGKSTGALLCASAAAADGLSVCVHDLDPQGSLSKGWGWAEGVPFTIKDLSPLPAKEYYRHVVADEGEFDLIVMDLPGKLSKDGLEEAATRFADVLVVPIEPTYFSFMASINYLKFALERAAERNASDPSHPLTVTCYVSRYRQGRKQSREMKWEMAKLNDLRTMLHPVFEYEAISKFDPAKDRVGDPSSAWGVTTGAWWFELKGFL